MIVLTSENGSVGIGAAIEILRAGGSALDAVEAACRVVEANLDDHTVGAGGYPNAAGVVELDASIMQGTDRRAGAVAALQGFPHPISVARAILEKLPHHVLLSGAGAARFAREHGFKPAELLTDASRAAWEKFRSSGETLPGMERVGVPASGASETTPMAEQEKAAADGASAKIAGTVNFLAQDGQGRVASAVSTSGWAFKYPGRVGDSPIIGAGNYCDDRFGACACTGVGEWSIRNGLARQLVLRLELGQSLDEAAAATLSDLESVPLPPGIDGLMNFVALDSRTGQFGGYCSRPGGKFVWQTPDRPHHEVWPATSPTPA